MNLLFDLDGTLTDPFPGITNCLLHALKKLGRELPPRNSLGWCIGPPLKTGFATLLDTDDETLLEEAIVIYRERFSTVGLFENQMYDRIPETLEHLREKGHTLYVATSKAGVFAKRIIDHFGLTGHFKAVYGSELDGTRSGKAELIAYIMKTEGLAPDETVMIGDREHDMIGAGANGIRGFGVLWGYGTKEELESTGAEKCFQNPGDLLMACG